MGPDAKKWFIYTALSYLGTPYCWGGDDPAGFDCSGYVLECLKTIGMVAENEDYNADSLLKKFAQYQVTHPQKGALLFYLNKTNCAFHVTICLDADYQIGANGGNAEISTLRQARAKNAFVKIRPIRFDPESHKVISLFDK